MVRLAAFGLIFFTSFFTTVTSVSAASAPVANAQGVVTSSGAAKTIALTGDDADSTALSFSVTSAPPSSQGALSAIASPSCATAAATRCTASITFTPATGFRGTTRFAFKVNDGALDSNVATVTISVGVDEGPGGPILLITSPANPFTRYYAEILRAEGLNQFAAADIASVSQSMLNSFDLVILGEMPLTSAQASMLASWVGGGGRLVAMRPDKQLASLLGLADTGAPPLSDAYLVVDPSSDAGAGITGDSMQFHGAADLYALNGASAVAMVYSAAGTATPNPAVSWQRVGGSGGQAAAFAFDLARSVVFTRQGNPAFAGRDREGDGVIRSDDLFYSGSQPDWLDVDKVAIPQADEQQRLLANLVLVMTRDRKPLPRFWYFPRNTNPQINVNKAVIVMTGDDHANGGTSGRFDRFKALSPANCSVADWECIRGSSYVYPGTAIGDAAAAAYSADGFEIGLHVQTNCQDWTPSSLESFYATQLNAWSSAFRSAPTPSTERTHCLTWSDFATQPAVELAHGIRLDTNYYYYPPALAANRPGFFTGSGLPMRFADAQGRLIDVYQATTQMTDESEQPYPLTVNTLLGNALGLKGYYGAFTVNAHTDQPASAVSDAIVGAAMQAGVPVVSGRQMLQWLDGRNASSFGFGPAPWDPVARVLTFGITAGAGANGLQAMLPTASAVGPLAANGIRQDGNPNPVAYTTQVIKGQEYAFFTAGTGTYHATYDVDATAPVISNLVAIPASDGTAAISWTTNERATTTVDYGTAAGSLTQRVTRGGLGVTHTVTLTGLVPLKTYFYRVTSVDGFGNSSTFPSGQPASIAIPSSMVVDTTVADFNAGTTGTATSITAAADGEVTLAPSAASEFSGSALPAGWSFAPWAAGGAATISGGALTVDGGLVTVGALQAAGRSLEFVATFGASAFQHAGFGQTLAGSNEPWAFFSTWNTTNNVYARSVNNGAAIDTLVPANLIGTAHRYRIDWSASSVAFFVDGQLVATHVVAIAGSMGPLVSDFNVGGGTVALDWLRMTPYATAGSFLSRIFSGSGTGRWGSATWTAATPAGTSVAMLVRTGNTSSPDGAGSDWTAFSALTGQGALVSSTAKFLQYRADLQTSDASLTPVLQDVTFGFIAGPLLAVTDDSVTTAEDTAATGNVLANDTDAVSAVIGSQPINGVVTLNANGSFSYMPAQDFNGTDSFTYRAQDSNGNSSNVATVTIIITARNDAPVAAADAKVDVEDTPLTIPVAALTANDSAGPANESTQTLTVVAVGGAVNGTAVLNPGGTITFTPAPNFNGIARFTYTVEDNGMTNGVADPKRATATVTVTVTSVNDPPVANTDSKTTKQNVPLIFPVADLLANDTAGPPDESGQTLTVTGVSASRGLVTILLGNVTYTPELLYVGPATISYTVCDNGTTNGAADPKCSTGTVNVTVTGLLGGP